jgi:hypothetical protein
MSNDFDWKLVQKGIDLTYEKAYTTMIFYKFVMFISDGKTVSSTFSAMPVSSRLSIPFGVGGQIYTRFVNEPAKSH